MKKNRKANVGIGGIIVVVMITISVVLIGIVITQSLRWNGVDNHLSSRTRKLFSPTSDVGIKPFIRSIRNLYLD